MLATKGVSRHRLAKAQHECTDALRSTGSHQTPPRLSELPMITPSASAMTAPTLSAPDAGAHQHRQNGRRLHRPDLFGGGRVAGPLSGRDHGVRVEELEVAGELRDRAVGGDGVGAVLDMAVGEDRHVLGVDRAR